MILKRYLHLIDSISLSGGSRDEDVVCALVELIGLCMKVKESPDLDRNWEKLTTYSMQDRDAAAKLIFFDCRWRIDYINKVFPDKENANLLGEAVRVVEEICEGLPQIELAWEIIELLNTGHGNEPASIPRELSVVLTDILNIDQSDSILSAGVSLLGTNIDLSKLVHELTWVSSKPDYIAEIILRVAGTNVYTQYVSAADFDTLSLSDKKYSKAVVHTPWGMKISQDVKHRWYYLSFDIRPTSVESMYIQYALKLVSGSVVAVVAPGFLFKTAGTDRDLKRFLVDKGYVRAVVRLPNKLFRTTSVAPNLLVLDKTTHHHSVVFIDASGEKFTEEMSRSLVKLKSGKDIAPLIRSCTTEEYCRVVATNELMNNDYNLDVNRYVLSREERELNGYFENKEVVELQQVAKILRAQALKVDEKGIKIGEANPSNIEPTGYLGKPTRYSKVDKYLLDRVDKQRLVPGDIVLAVKGSIGRVAIVPEGCSNHIYAGQSFVILRLKSNSPISDPIVLYSYLASNLVQTLVNSKAAGATVRMIKMQDVSALPVVVPTVEQQKHIVANHAQVQCLYKEIESIEEKIESLKEQYWIQ